MSATWDAMGARERGEWIRQNTRDGRLNVRWLFCLTAEGFDMIRRGDIWRPEYEAPPPRLQPLGDGGIAALRARQEPKP